MIKEKKKSSGFPGEESVEQRELVLHNDDTNTFDFVIDTLIEVCEHDPLQAEQCTLVAHYKGKCSVKTGELSELESAQSEMSRRGLTVSIE